MPDSISEWSDSDWKDWFKHDVEASGEWGGIRDRSRDEAGEVPSVVLEMASMTSMPHPAYGLSVIRRWPGYARHKFSRLSPEIREAFYFAWMSFTEPVEFPEQVDVDGKGYESTVTMPDGTTVAVHTDSEVVSEYHKRTARERAATRARRAKLVVAVVIGGGLLLGGFWIATSGDDSDVPAATAPTDQAAEETTSEDSTGGDSSADVSADSEAGGVVVDPCVARRQEQIVLDLHSPDFSSGVSDPGDIVEMPIFFTSAPNAGNQENLTPTLIWSEVPPETTEIAVFIGLAPEEPWDEYRDEDNIYEQLIPLSAEWMLAGLDPATTSLHQTALSIPAPDGSILLGPPFQSTAVSEDRLIFGVVALCDRDVDRPPSIGSLKSDAIAVGQFRASPGQ